MLCYPIDCNLLLCLWDSPGKNTGVGCHALLLGILPTQGPNPHFLFLALAGEFFTTRLTWQVHIYIISLNSYVRLSGSIFSPFLANFQLSIFALLCLRPLCHNWEGQFCLIWRKWKRREDLNWKYLGNGAYSSVHCTFRWYNHEVFFFFLTKSVPVPHPAVTNWIKHIKASRNTGLLS